MEVAPTRQRILETALDLFGARGVDAVSLDEIARVVGVRKQTVLYWFPSKTELVDAVLTEAASELVAVIDAAVRAAPDEPLARIDAVIVAVFRPAVRRPALLGLVREIGRLSPDHADRLRAHLAPLVDRAVLYLGAEMDAGRVRRADPRLVAALAYATAAVTGELDVGGLVGRQMDASVEQAYASGPVQGETNVGGFMGRNLGTITASFFDSSTTDQAQGVDSGDTSGVDFLTDPTDPEAYFGWDFDNDWFAYGTRPFLRSEHSTTISNVHQLQLMAMDLEAAYHLAANLAFGQELEDEAGHWLGAGFAPVGQVGLPFTGAFDGRGHTIAALRIGPGHPRTGLFGRLEDGYLVAGAGKIEGSREAGRP